MYLIMIELEPRIGVKTLYVFTPSSSPNVLFTGKGVKKFAEIKDPFTANGKLKALNVTSE